MSRDIIEAPKQKRTTVDTNATLLQRVDIHTKRTDGDSLNKFLKRALINQLEKEGDIEIRSIIEQEDNEYDN